MSYDFPDDYVPPPKAPWPTRGWFVDRYYRLVLWAALDCRAGFVNELGLKLIHRMGGRR